MIHFMKRKRSWKEKQPELELRDKTLFDDGAITGIRIYRELQNGRTDNMKIAEACGCTIEEVEKIRKQLNSQTD